MKKEQAHITSIWQAAQAYAMAFLVLATVLMPPSNVQARTINTHQTEQGSSSKGDQEETPDAFVETGMSAVISQVITLDFSQFAQFTLVGNYFAFAQNLSIGHVDVFPALLTYYRNLLLHSIMRHAP